MSLSGGKTKSKATETTNQTQTQALTDWSRDQWEKQTGGILGMTQDFAGREFMPYTKPMVAGLGAGQQMARDMVYRDMGAGGGLLDDAAAAAKAGGAATWTPEAVMGPSEITAQQVAAPERISYRQFDAERIKQRQNPFISNVVNAAEQYANEARDRQITDNQARATAAGAYGGSRHGIADAEIRRKAAMDTASMNADLLYRGYNDAMAADERESGNLMAADQYNSQAGYGANVYNANARGAADLYNSQSGYNARMADAQRRDAAAQFASQRKFQEAGLLGNLSQQKAAQMAQQAQLLEQFGATEREIEQARLLADRAEFDREAADRLNKFMLELQVRQGILGSTPMMQTQTSSGTGTRNQSGTNFGFEGWKPFG
jgi:hypothetical protein